MAIIRRMDLDADARLTMLEFIDGLKPSEPYSRMLKRDQLKSNEKSVKERHSRRQSTSFYAQNDEVFFNQEQNDPIRSHAFDRSWR